MNEAQVVSMNISMLYDVNLLWMLTVFLPIYVLIRTVKRSLPVLLGGG